MIVAIIAIVITFLLLKYWFSSDNHPQNYKRIPMVKGSLPFVGHGPYFMKDIIGFIRNAYKQYGPIFKIKIFRTNMVVVCDRNLISTFAKLKEPEMSMYNVLVGLFFADAFFDNPSDFSASIALVRKTVAVKFDEFVPKIYDEAKKMMRNLEKLDGKIVDINKEMINFVSRTSARCFVDVDLDSNFMYHLTEFTKILNKIVVLTHFLPRWILRKTLGYYYLRPHRKFMTNYLDNVIESYRTDPTKKTSMIIRESVNYKNEKGEKLSNEQIGDIIVCLLYVSSENTALGLSATITELAYHEKYWNKVQNECQKFLESGDIKSLFVSPTINSAVMEAARLCSHIFALNRKPAGCLTLGDYYVGNVDTVALCEPMLMSYDCSSDKFSNALEYNPDRFFSPTNEPLDANSILTWGPAGMHLCPGKQFALYEIKMATALITTRFERFTIDKNEYQKPDYFSPSAFVERRVNVKINLKDKKIREEIETEEKERIKIINNATNNTNKYHMENINNVAWILRDYLSIDEQINLYKYTINLSADSDEHKEITTVPVKVQFPITYYDLVYTGTSNCKEPVELLRFAKNVCSILHQLDKTNFNIPTEYIFDSVYAQLYGNGGEMACHYDKYVSWGVSLNLGASCDFKIDDRVVTLHSGDVIVADFSKVFHGIVKIYSENVPGWFSLEEGMEQENEQDEEIKTFGRIRCSIQIRNSSNKPDKLMTMKEFKTMLGVDA